jgi:preprotein translocase subunit Sss1
MREGKRSLAIAVATIAGVAVVTIGLIGLIVPRPTDPLPSDSAAPIADLKIPPDEVGGVLTVDGDRTGSLRLDSARTDVGFATEGRPEVTLGDLWLNGPDGRVAFSRDPDKGITKVDFDGLSFFIEPDDCTVTPGALNAASRLQSVEVRCEQLEDVRDNGTIGLAGVVAVPSDLLGERGDLPPSGGSVSVGEQTLEFSKAAVIVGGGIIIGETERTPLTLIADDEGGGNPDDWWGQASVLGVEQDPQSGAYVLTSVLVRGEMMTLATPCPVAGEELGDLNDWTRVVELRFDCQDADLTSGETVAIDGMVVVDVLDGLVEVPQGG